MLSGAALKAVLKTAILDELQSAFPAPGGTSEEVTAFNQAQDKLATAIADGAGPEIVTHVLGITISIPSGGTPGSPLLTPTQIAVT